MSLLEKNSLPLGFGLGLVSPIIGSALVYFIFAYMVASGWMDESMGGIHSKRMRTTILIGICTNIFWIRKSNSPSKTEQLRGITIATMVCCVVWFAFYFSSLYDD